MIPVRRASALVLATDLYVVRNRVLPESAATFRSRAPVHSRGREGSREGPRAPALVVSRDGPREVPPLGGSCGRSMGINSSLRMLISSGAHS